MVPRVLTIGIRAMPQKACVEDPPRVDGVVLGAGAGPVHDTVQHSEKAQAQVQWKTQWSVVQQKKVQVQAHAQV